MADKAAIPVRGQGSRLYIGLLVSEARPVIAGYFRETIGGHLAVGQNQAGGQSSASTPVRLPCYAWNRLKQPHSIGWRNTMDQKAVALCCLAGQLALVE